MAVVGCQELFNFSKSVSVLLSLHTCEGHQKDRTSVNFTVRVVQCCVSLSYLPDVTQMLLLTCPFLCISGHSLCTTRTSWPLSHSDRNSSRFCSAPSENRQSDTLIISTHPVVPSLHCRIRTRFWFVSSACNSRCQRKPHTGSHLEIGISTPPHAPMPSAELDALVANTSVRRRQPMPQHCYNHDSRASFAARRLIGGDPLAIAIHDSSAAKASLGR